MEQDSIRISNAGFVWHELMSTDPEESKRFYREVAGVSVARTDGDQGYPLLIADGQPVGGIAGPQPDGWPSGGPEAHWLAYLGTDDVERAVRTAQALGGDVLLPPVDVPGIGRAAVLRDTQGAAFGVFEPVSR